MNAHQLKQDIERDLDRIESQCPYDPVTEKNLWLVYHWGLYRGLILGQAQKDYDLRRELKRRAETPLR